jgi:PKD repeat protein
MKRFYNLLGFLVLLTVIISCSEEDPLLPLPNIDFSTDPEIIEVGKDVVFENMTTNASSYKWDFGDGRTSTEINPTIQYDEAGQYIVTLIAYTDDEQSDSLSVDIDVYERVMKALQISGLKFVNRNGEDWDDPTGQPDSTKYPDFILAMGPISDPGRLLITPMLVDLAPFELPIPFELNPSGDPYVMTNEDWELTFIDFDGEDLENAQENDFEIMETITFNPVIIPTSDVDENGDGFIQVSLDQYAIDFIFKLE